MGVESSVAQNLPETATLDLLLATFEEDVQEISSPQGDATAVTFATESSLSPALRRGITTFLGSAASAMFRGA